MSRPPHPTAGEASALEPGLDPRAELGVHGTGSSPNAALKQRVRAAIEAHPAPRRATVQRRLAAWTLGGWAISLCVFAYEGGPRVTDRPWPLVFGTALGTAAIAGLAAWIVFSRGRSPLGRSRKLLLPIVIASAPLIFVWKVVYSSLFAGALVAWPTRPGVRCLALNLALAAAPLLAFALARRGTEAQRPILAGIAGAVAVGAMATLLTDLWCPVAYVPHLLLGHVLPVALLAAFGALLGHSLLALRSK